MVSTPRSSFIFAVKSSLPKVNMPQSVWWMLTISSVPSNRSEMTKGADSVLGDPPAGAPDHVRDPNSSPRNFSECSLASMHVTTASPRAGGHRQGSPVERSRVPLVGLSKLVEPGHRTHLSFIDYTRLF